MLVSWQRKLLKHWFIARVIKIFREYGMEKYTFNFEENDESRLYRKFQDTWTEYYSFRREIALQEKQKKRTLRVRFTSVIDRS